MTRPRGSLPDWRPRTARQKGILADLVARYLQHRDEDTLPRGGRGIFYDLRPGGMGNGITYMKPTKEKPARSFGPMEAHPAAVQETLGLARRAGIIPEWWVADRRAVEGEVPYYDDSAEDDAERIARSVAEAPARFELDPQRFQPVYVEVLCEAGDLVPRLSRVAGQRGVPVYTGSGFDGLKSKRAMGDRAADRDVPTVVLHVGDRDKHGEALYRAAGEDAVGWSEELGEVRPVEDGPPDLGDVVDGIDVLTFARLALTEEQADDLDLLDAEGKAEVDGVPVQTMDGWLTEALDDLADSACRERLEAEQQRERERLPGLIREKLDEAA